MKQLALILLLILLGLGHAHAQKSKIKDEAGTSNPDSVKADGIGKAAIRGGQLMQDARDSLRGADLQPPTDIVDTFGIQTVRTAHKSFVRRTELESAQKRLAAAKAVAEQATFDLELAKTDPKVTPKQVQDAESMLKQLQDYLNVLESRLTALIYDWEETTGARLEDTAEQAKTATPPKTPAKPGAKDAIKGGKGK